MSKTFHLVCAETETQVSIGQGWDEMTCLYYEMPKVMEALKKFLNKNAGKPLKFLCLDTASYDAAWPGYHDFADDEEWCPEDHTG